jgi:NADPH:quinone reductase-like Zn-dependent oxidoreductase
VLAVQFDEPGPIDALRLNEVPRPSPGSGQVVIEFEASTINPADVKIRSGSIAPRAGSSPFTLGYDLVGTIVEHGAGAGKYCIGTRVVAMSAMALTGRGTWSDFVSLPEESVAPAPEGISPATAAQLPLAGLTAYQAIQVLDPAPRARILVAGAAGAIGRLAVQILRTRDAIVHAVVRRPEQAASLPSEAVDDVRIGDVGDLVVDGVLDTFGGDFSEVLAEGGRYVSVVPGCLPAKTAPSMSGKTAKVIVTRESGAMLDELTRMVERGELHLPEPRVFPMADIHRAHAEFEKGLGQRIAIVR